MLQGVKTHTSKAAKKFKSLLVKFLAAALWIRKMTPIQEPERESHNSHLLHGRAPSDEEALPSKQVDAIVGSELLESNKGGSIVAESNWEHCDTSLAQQEQGNVSVNAHSTTTTQSSDHTTNKEPLDDEVDSIFDMESPAHAVHKSVVSDDNPRGFHYVAQHFNGSSLRSTMKIVRTEASTLPYAIEEEQDDYVPPYNLDGEESKDADDIKDGDEFKDADVFVDGDGKTGRSMT